MGAGIRTGVRIMACTAVAAALFATGTVASAQSTAADGIGRSPLSASTLVNRALRSGAITVGGAHGAIAQPGSPDATALPNVKASNAGANPVNETPITANPINGNQLMSGGNDYSCSSLQGFYNSDNGGTTWRQHCMPGDGCGDPNVAYDLTGKAYIAGISSCSGGGLALQSSTDNGVTWGPETLAFTSILGGLVDKNWMEIDTNSASPFKNCLYVSWTDFNSAFTQTRASVAHSCNGGSTWTRVPVDSTQTTPKVDQFTDLAIGADGTVYLSWMQCQVSGPAGDCGNTTVQMKFSKSTDGGNSWTSPSIMATAQTAPDSTFGCYYGCFPGSSERLSNIPVIDVDKGDGSLHVAFYTYTGGNTRMEETHSTNGGTSWSAPAQIATNPGNMGWQWLSVSSTGTVAVSLWFSQVNGKFITGAAFSTDGGATFPTKVKTSSQPSFFVNDGFNGGFIGDYSGSIWVGSGTLHMSWTDARNGQSPPSVDMTGGSTFP